MNQDNDVFADVARQVLADHCSSAVVRAIEAAGRAAPEAAALWAQLEATGLADALLPEDEGGAGLALAQVFGVLEQCGAHALPLPLGETMIARALLASAGVQRPAGSIALARGEQLPGGGLRCPLARSGAVAASVLVQAGADCHLLAVDGAQIVPLALDAALAWDAAQLQAAPRIAAQADLRTLQAAVLAPQMAGAVATVFQRTLQYANERQQFGRPIGKFQAIQHQLAVMSEHVFAARMAAQLGCSGGRDGAGIEPDLLRVATAKARCSEAALAVSELAHSIHGAIGFTAEYDLQLYTRRLHTWRQSAGSESWWHDVAGSALLEHQGLTLDIVRRMTDVSVAA